MNATMPSALTTVPVIPPHPAMPGGGWLADWNRRDFLEVAATETAPGEVREMIRKRLHAWGLGDLVDLTELIATELVTNAAAATRQSTWEGGEPPVRVWLLGGAGVLLLVWDGVSREPVKRVADPLDESGRGLFLVEMLSAGWDFYFPRHPFWGKVTRALITTP